MLRGRNVRRGEREKKRAAIEERRTSIERENGPQRGTWIIVEFTNGQQKLIEEEEEEEALLLLLLLIISYSEHVDCSVVPSNIIATGTRTGEELKMLP